MTHEEAIKQLKKILRKGDTVYSVLRHVSRSGMMRHISFYAIKGNKPVFLDGHIEAVTSYKRVPMGKGEGLKVSGCGMDMGFSVVYNLSCILFPRNRRDDRGYNLASKWI